MERFDVQGLTLNVSAANAFEYIADAKNLPQWTNAFANVHGSHALLSTPQGEVQISLEVKASAKEGTVDWYMTFPDGSLGKAYSRIVPESENACIYTFTLMAPPVPLEELEGALNAQKEILAAELTNLKSILEH